MWKTFWRSLNLKKKFESCGTLLHFLSHRKFILAQGFKVLGLSIKTLFSKLMISKRNLRDGFTPNCSGNNFLRALQTRSNRWARGWAGLQSPPAYGAASLGPGASSRSKCPGPQVTATALQPDTILWSTTRRVNTNDPCKVLQGGTYPIADFHKAHQAVEDLNRFVLGSARSLGWKAGSRDLLRTPRLALAEVSRRLTRGAQQGVSAVKSGSGSSGKMNSPTFIL